jgi:aspartyl-tRNA synthetase
MAALKKIQIKDTLDHVGKDVLVQGWVHTVRDMGKIAFIELRDSTGVLQLVSDSPDKLPKIGNEYVISVKGQVRKRGERYVNPKLVTGTVELGIDELEVLSVSEELPFELKDTSVVNEELRLKHRYLDLRSERMTKNILMRHQVIKFVRNFLDDQDFVEIETPMLTKGTPEGAREFLVPSRLHPEQFYVLPQSPQQFKQLLMVGGIGRYYQIAKCLRDEDQRGDRQPEFTQIDMEMSFVSQEDILEINENMMIQLVKELFPEKHITKAPFPRLTYAESMEKYGSDRPDLRKDKNDPNELAFCWVTDFPMFEINSESSKIDAVHHPFTAPKPEDKSTISKDPMKVRADAYDLALNGSEIGGGSVRIHDRDLQHQVLELLGLGKSEIEARFGHILEAFKYGVPPHGGIAYGLDRLLMIFLGEPNIREVMAFPKTGDGRDPLTGAPSPASAEALKEAHIQTVHPKKRR